MDEHPLAWDDLRVVLAISRAGSLTGAAQRLGISHPTVFRRINQIERALGARLFERSRSGYAVTSAGEEMVAVAIRTEAEVEALARRLAGRDLRPSGTVRVTTTDTLMFGPLSPVLVAFSRQHPEIKLEMTIANTLFSLSKREADVAIRPSPNPPDPLVGRKVAAIASAIYRPRAGAAVDPDRLAEHDWVIPDDSLSHLPVMRWLEQRRLDQRAVLRANSLAVLCVAARDGAGLVVLPCYLGDLEPGLKRVGDPIGELVSELWLLTHPDLRRVARVRAFLDAVAQLLQPLRPLFEGRDIEGRAAAKLYSPASRSGGRWPLSTPRRRASSRAI